MIDVLVAGGGPVGLAAAVRARQLGLTVTVVEPRRTPVDKACGEGLMPSAVTAVRALGVEPVGVPFRGIRYVRDDHAVEGFFRAGCGLGVRRTTLHAALAARARELGVQRVTGRVTGIQQHRGHVEADGRSARWLIAADGLHSPVRRHLGLDRPVRTSPRYGLRRHFTAEPWTDLVEVHWCEDAEAYVTPVAPHEVGVALLSGPGRRYEEILGRFPALLARLAAAAPSSDVRGAGPLHQVARTPAYGRVLLVGDAAGYVDALTGEGLATGLATAAAAVDALAAGRPEQYAAAWRAATRRYRWMTTALLRAGEQPALRRALVPAAARAPWLFTRAVNALA